MIMNVRVVAIAVCTATLALAGCSSANSSGSGTNPAPPTYAASLSASSLSFTQNIGLAASATQIVTLSSTGTGTLTLSAPALSGTNAALFTLSSSTCGTTLAPGTSCTVAVGFAAAAASGAYTGTVTFTDNASPSTQTVSLTGTATALASSAFTGDCSVTGGTCNPTFTGASITGELPSDLIATGGFHGYADPAIRKDPNSSYVYIAYSWAKTLVDGTHVVDLHLASSNNSGATFTEIGPLYQSVQTTQTATTAYSSVDDSSTETVDILPIALTGANAGQTLWVQAHQSYLVTPQGGIYDQLNATNLISVTAVQLASPAGSSAGTSLLALSSASTGEARLGAAGTSPVRSITQSLYGLNAATSKCANWGQPTLWYQSGTLYLALECTEFSGTGQLDGNELAHFVYSTAMTPTLTNASTWTWAYVGEFATPAQAGKLGALPSENVAYQFFTEPEFVQTRSGQLTVVMTPGVFNTLPTATQPVTQYGCRMVPVTLTPTSVTLDIDATTSAPVVIAKVTENDLYTGVNEGPAACTYEPAIANGIIMGRKYEDDPTLGFYIYPLNSGVLP